MNKRCIIVANWKSNKSPYEAEMFMDEFKDLCEGVEIPNSLVICPPAISLYVMSENIQGTNIQLGLQNFINYEGGAFTGENSLKQILPLNVNYALVGHSERRQYFLENDDIVNIKTIEALSTKITPIVCVGESLEEREQDKTTEVITRQVKGAIKDIDDKEMIRNIIWAYEPVWAIGTGKTATADEADKVCHLIKDIVAEEKGVAIQEIRVLYGGSVKESNFAEFLSSISIDGILVGGASLDPQQFFNMAKKRIVTLDSIQNEPTKRLAVR